MNCCGWGGVGKIMGCEFFLFMNCWMLKLDCWGFWVIVLNFDIIGCFFLGELVFCCWKLFGGIIWIMLSLLFWDDFIGVSGILDGGVFGFSGDCLIKLDVGGFSMILVLVFWRGCWVGFGVGGMGVLLMMGVVWLKLKFL